MNGYKLSGQKMLSLIGFEERPIFKIKFCHSYSKKQSLHVINSGINAFFSYSNFKKFRFR